MVDVATWKAIITGRDGPRGSCGKKALNRQIFIVGNLQFVDSRHVHEALCTAEYKLQKWQRKYDVRWRLPMGGVVAPLKNGAVSHPEAPRETATIYHVDGKHAELAVA